MTVTFRLAKLTRDRILFGFSPAQEAMHSLHVLLDPKHHPLHIPWVLRARTRMTAGLKAEIEAYSFLFHKSMPVFWDIRQDEGLRSFTEELAMFEQQACDRFVSPLTGMALGRFPQRHTVTESMQREALEKAALNWPPAVPILTEAFCDPVRSRKRFVQCLQAYWDACLASEWPEIEALFVRDIERRARTLYRAGVLATLGSLTREIVVNHQTDSCSVRHPHALEIAFSEEDQLYLMPSYFSWPHVFVSPSMPKAMMTYPIVDQEEAGRPPVPPERLLKLLRAAGDVTRLQILQLLAEHPRSTQELAGLIRISEAAVSKHLKQLQEAGFAVSERQSYYVFYKLVKDPLAELTTGLEATLGGK